jgi:hypothetical protein
MALLYQRRNAYANLNKARWISEFHYNAERDSPWPYTHLIQGLGGAIRLMHVFVPLASGACLVASMFVHGH